MMHFDSKLKDFPSRIKAVRKLLVMVSRKEFGNLLNIPAPTISNWEIGKAHITPAYLDKLIEALAVKANIILTKEWLINGRGDSPFGEGPTLDPNYNEEKQFLLANPKAILFKVPNNSYEPLYFAGDLIGALLIDPATLPHMSLALVECSKNRMYIKKLVVSDKGLICFLPIELPNLEKAMDYKPSMKIYKIVWFKSQHTTLSS